MRTRNAPKYDDTDGLIAALKKQARSRKSSKSNLNSIKAAWLIDGQLGSPRWTIRERADAPPEIIDFCISLPDGTTLTDPQNNKCLTLIQRIFYAARCGHLHKANQETSIRLIKWLFKFTQWVYLNKHIFEPEKYAFGKVTNDDIDTLLDMLADGSWASALCIINRSLDAIHQSVYGYAAPSTYHDNLFNLPDKFIDDAIKWLTKHEKYVKSEIVSRAWLSTAILSPVHKNDKKIRLFLRQFEPTVHHDRLLARTSRGIRNHIDSRTVSIESVHTKTAYAKTFYGHVDKLHSFMQANYIDPKSFPNITINKDEVKEYKSIYSDRLMITAHTPKIPYGVGMHVLTSAIEWIVLYGKAIVDMTLHIAETISSGIHIDYLAKNIRDWSKPYVTNAYPGHPSAPLFAALDINTLTASRTGGTNRSFSYVLSAFIGACAVLIAMFKPIRQEELSSIKRSGLLTRNSNIEPYKDLLSTNPVGLTESLYTDEMYDSGAFIVHENKKAGTAALNPNICRPIPYVTTIAVQLLQRLGNGLSCIYQDISSNNDRLFYFPSLRDFSKVGTLGTATRIDHALIRFSDIIDVPREKDGTRWYIRTHEMRKFFIYTMYYHEPNYVADGISWHAGHASAKELNSYTSTIGVDDEVIELQTESVVDKLISHELHTIPTTSIAGLAGLYNDVLLGFKVKSVKGLPTAKFHDFVRRLIYEKKVETAGYTIVREMLDGTILDTEIAIKFGEQVDAKYVPR